MSIERRNGTVQRMVISQISNEQAYRLDISLPKVAVHSEEAPVHTSEATFKLLTHPRLLDAVE